MTPLWVIVIFVLLVETIMGFVTASIPQNVILILFVAFFPVLVFSAFIVILWNRPWVCFAVDDSSIY